MTTLLFGLTSSPPPSGSLQDTLLTLGVGKAPSDLILLGMSSNPSGILDATGDMTWARAYVKFRGTIRVILPDAGAYDRRRVEVTAYDIMRQLAEEDVREVPIQVEKTETELLTTLLDALPSESQPVARDFDPAVDEYPIAFDDLGNGAKAMSVVHDLMISAFGLAFAKGDGTFCYRSRHSLAVEDSRFAFDNNMHGLVVPSSLDQVYRKVRTINNPRRPSPEATDVLYELPSGTSVEVPGFATREVWTDYTDPLDRQTRLGGAEVNETLVAGVHYAANSAADGSGVDLTDAVTVTLDAFASTAKWTIVNTGAAKAHMTLLAPIGKAVRNPGPQTYEASTGAANKPLEINLPYQDNATIARGVARHVLRLYGGGVAQQIEAIEFMANYSQDYLEQALAREPGDMITVSEEVTGIAAVLAVIQSVELRVTDDGAVLWCRWGLAPGTATAVWRIGVPGKSEIGVSTFAGF